MLRRAGEFGSAEGFEKVLWGHVFPITPAES